MNAHERHRTAMKGHKDHVGREGHEVGGRAMKAMSGHKDDQDRESHERPVTVLKVMKVVKNHEGLEVS